MLHFLSNIHGESNLLLKAVAADLKVSGLVAGKGLGTHLKACSYTTMESFRRQGCVHL